MFWKFPGYRKIFLEFFKFWQALPIGDLPKGRTQCFWSKKCTCLWGGGFTVNVLMSDFLYFHLKTVKTKYLSRTAQIYVFFCVCVYIYKYSICVNNTRVAGQFMHRKAILTAAPKQHYYIFWTILHLFFPRNIFHTANSFCWKLKKKKIDFHQIFRFFKIKILKTILSKKYWSYAKHFCGQKDLDICKKFENRC